MGKTRDDKAYEKGVRDGQRGGGLEDFVQGQSGSPYDKGYEYGARHRYGSEGRYHTWDNRGSNDPESKGSISSGGGGDGGGFPGISLLVGFFVVTLLIGFVIHIMSNTVKRYFPSKEVKTAWNLEYIARYGGWESHLAADKLEKYKGKYDTHPYIKHVKAKRKEKLTEMWNRKASLEYLSQFEDSETRKKAEQWLITYYDAAYGAGCNDLSPGVRLRCRATLNQLKSEGKTKPSGVMY